MNKIIKLISKLIVSQDAFAHCDIPCGIYDPHAAQLAAHTIIRMTKFLSEIKRDNEIKAEHDIARVVIVKEKHADLLEHELETLRNDYFKSEHYDKFPELKDLYDNVFKLIAKTRQNIDTDSSKETLEMVLKISEIFYLTKDVTPIRIKSIYPTELDIVTYK